jgi:hypothetical protein
MIIFVGTFFRGASFAWLNNCEDQLKKLFQVDTCRAFISSMEEQFIDMEEEKENLREDDTTSVQGRYTRLHRKDGGLKLPTMHIWNCMARGFKQWPQRKN